LQAVIFGFINKYPIFFTEPSKPEKFDYFNAQLDFKSIMGYNKVSELVTNKGTIKVGLEKYLLWEKLIFLMALEGRVPLSNLCNKMRYDDKKIVCTNEYSKIYEFTFDTCYYFGDANISNLVNYKKSTNKTYFCYDYIAMHKGGKHKYDLISTDDDFIKQIWFYSSERIYGDTGVKDACLVSVLDEGQLWDPNYSETIARFKFEKILKNHGVRGPLNGQNKRYSIKTSHMARHKKFATESMWTETDKIKKVNLDEDALISKLLSAHSKTKL
tara:strand:- start:242 stop:1054 length:813 start_codon:yes stop_codon:yes gene_type:complete